MRHHLLSPAAKQDLADIWDYSEQTWGSRQAAAYIFTIRQAIDNVADHPVLGKQRPDVLPGYYSVAAGRRVIFYRYEGNAIVVIRILHHRMDPARHIY